MTEEYTIFEGYAPFRVVHLSHSFWWLLFFGWNIGLILSWIQMFGESLRITSQRLIISRGLFSKIIEEVEFYRVNDTTLSQTFGQRLLGIGTITLLSDDATAPNLSVVMGNPETYREQIRACVKEERKRMRSRQLD